MLHWPYMGLGFKGLGFRIQGFRVQAFRVYKKLVFGEGNLALPRTEGPSTAPFVRFFTAKVGECVTAACS